MQELLDPALESCVEADAMSMRHFQRDVRIDAEPDRSFVAQADHQAMLIDGLGATVQP